MADISVTIPNSTFTITSVSSGIEVTTPTEVVVEVSSGSQTIDITSTQNEIIVAEVGITNTDQLIEGTTNLFFTNARARAAISLTTDDSSVLGYNTSTGVFTWDTPTTTKILEGTNLYYTTARANTDFDTRFATKDTDDLAEGTTNKYFSQALARQSLSAGTGISYDSNTGVITNTSINTDTTYTISSASTSGGANLTLTGSDSSTDSVAYLGAGATTVTRTDANTITITSTDTNTTYTQNISSTTGGANLNLVGSDATTDTVKFANGTGVTVAYTDANTATVSIGQSVATTDNVTFGSVNIDSRAILDTATLTTSATTADQVLDSFNASAYRTAKYIVSVTSGSAYESVELLVIHDGTTAYQTTYAELRTGSDLASFSVDISGGNVRLLTTPANAVTAYNVTRTAIVV